MAVFCADMHSQFNTGTCQQGPYITVRYGVQPQVCLGSVATPVLGSGNGGKMRQRWSRKGNKERLVLTHRSQDQDRAACYVPVVRTCKPECQNIHHTDPLLASHLEFVQVHELQVNGVRACAKPHAASYASIYGEESDVDLLNLLVGRRATVRPRLQQPGHQRTPSVVQCSPHVAWALSPDWCLCASEALEPILWP